MFLQVFTVEVKWPIHFNILSNLFCKKPYENLQFCVNSEVTGFASNLLTFGMSGIVT